MNNQEILAHIDHTRLQAVTTWADIRQLCDEALQYHTASVCIPPTYVGRVKSFYGDTINICTVIGFPLGYHTMETKAAEARQALADGASEFDMVVNLGDVKDGAYAKITQEIAVLKQIVGGKILKVIVETCYLTQTEKIAMCGAVTAGGADYIKTSTGFGTAGAVIEDIRLFKDHIGQHVRMKAAGGVKTKEDLELFLQEGCERIGTSSAVKMLKDEEVTGY